MSEHSEIQGRISNQIKLEYIKKHAQIFSTKEFGIVLTDEEMSIPAGQHVHSSYEFLIPLNSPFIARIGNISYTVNSNAIFPINSEQYHGPENAIDNFQCLTIDIKEKYLQIISTELFGYQDICFENISSPVLDNTRLLIELFMDEYKNKQVGYTFIMENLSTCIAINLLRNYKNNRITQSEGKKHFNNHNIQLVIDFLNENYNIEYSMDDIAKIANYSPYHLIRIFKDTTGMTPYEYLMNIKVKKAKSLLKDTNNPILEICYTCGFNNPNHFISVFKRRTKITPSEYRKLC